jgi:hypothetical protein
MSLAELGAHTPILPVGFTILTFHGDAPTSVFLGGEGFV